MENRVNEHGQMETPQPPASAQPYTTPNRDKLLEVILKGDLATGWRVSLFINIYFGPVIRELENTYGMTQAEFAILYCLSLLPGINARDVCAVTGRPQNSISRGVNRLLKRQFISQESDRKDRRRRILKITESGRVILKPLTEIHRNRQLTLFSKLTDTDRYHINRIFDKLIFK